MPVCLFNRILVKPQKTLGIVALILLPTPRTATNKQHLCLNVESLLKCIIYLLTMASNNKDNRVMANKWTKMLRHADNNFPCGHYDVLHAQWQDSIDTSCKKW